MGNSSKVRTAVMQALGGVTLTEEDAQAIIQAVHGAFHPGYSEQPDMNQRAVAASTAPMGIGEPTDTMKVGPYLTGSPKQARYTRAEVFESNAAHDTKAVQRNLSAAQFLRAHPEFETFLDLIKDGAITLY